jgi:hypothetical protein
MTSAECMALVRAYLTKVVTLINSPPEGTAIFISEDNVKGFKFSPGAPMYFYPVATTAGEETTLKTGTEDFINVTTYTRWSKTSGAWVATVFSGQSTVVRQCTLLLAKNTGELYLYGNDHVFYPIDSTSETV